MKCGSHMPALLVPGGRWLGGRIHLGDLWLEAGHRLALVGNHVTLSID
jgi:hypothetical protein